MLEKGRQVRSLVGCRHAVLSVPGSHLGQNREELSSGCFRHGMLSLHWCLKTHYHFLHSKLLSRIPVILYLLPLLVSHLASVSHPKLSSKVSPLLRPMCQWTLGRHLFCLTEQFQNSAHWQPRFQPCFIGFHIMMFHLTPPTKKALGNHSLSDHGHTQHVRISGKVFSHTFAI